MRQKSWRENVPWAGRIIDRVQHYPRLKKAAVVLAGCTVLLVGIVMIVTPGPAIVFIPAGLAILATEFQWAKRALIRFRWLLRKVLRKFR
jgi:tellurite resistance protein TerC